MKDGQDEIYFAFGPNEQLLKTSPHLEVLKKRGFEVLYLTDGIDQFAIESLPEYDDKKLVNAMTEKLELDATDEEKEESEQKAKDLEPLTQRFQEVLDEQVQEVRVSDRLADSPVCLVIPEGGMAAHIELLMRAHKQDLPKQKRILEINPDHPVVQQLQRLSAGDGDDTEFSQWSQLLFDQALVAEGCLPEDPAQLARSIEQLMRKAAEGAS